MVRRPSGTFDLIQGVLSLKPDLLDGEDANYVDADCVGSNEKGRRTFTEGVDNGENVLSNVLSESILSDDSNSERFYCPFVFRATRISTPRVVNSGGKAFTSSICTYFSRWYGDWFQVSTRSRPTNGNLNSIALVWWRRCCLRG